MSAKAKPRAAAAQAPEGWEVVRFGEIVRNVNETERDPVAAGLDRLIGLEHLEPASLRVRRWGSVADGTSFTKRFRAGQVLFGKRRAYQRKVAVPDFDGICSGDILVFEADSDRLDPKLLPFLVQADGFFDHALGTSAGSLSPRTKWQDLAKFLLTLPPRKKQAEMVDLLIATERVITSYEDAVESAGAAELAVSEAVLFGRRLGEDLKRTRYGDVPKSWDLTTIGDAGRVQLGRQRAPKYQSGKHSKPYLRVANVFDGHLDLNDVLTMDFDERDFETFKLTSGDVLLNEGQSRELVGRCCIYRGEVEDCCFQNTLVRFAPSARVLSEFAFTYFRFLFHKGAFAQIASQTTSIAHLGAERFAALPMPVPPVPAQQQIISQLSGFGSATRHLTAALGDSRSLKAELLRKISNGGSTGASHVQ